VVLVVHSMAPSCPTGNTFTSVTLTVKN
jgi:hypothetical protein